MKKVFIIQHTESLVVYGAFSKRKKAEKYINNRADLVIKKLIVE